MREGVLPGDIVLFAPQTREKISIKFKPRIESRDLYAIPNECILAYIPADAETRKKAVEELKAHYDEALLEFIKIFGGDADAKIVNEWKYG